MSIQGGGGKPPDGPKGPVHKGKGKAVRASQRSATSHNRGEEKARKAAKDTYAGKTRGRAAVENVRRVEEIISKMPTSTSGIENMVKILETTRAQLVRDLALLKESASVVVGKIAERRFSKEAVAAHAGELREIRARMAQLRRRLNDIHRRLRVAFSTAGKLGYANLAQRLGAQMDRVKKLEPGVQRALFALELAEQLYGKGGEPGTTILRAPMTAAVPKAAAAAYLAEIAPSATIARRIAGLIAEGPHAPQDAAKLPAHQALHDRARDEAADPTLDSFAAFHDAMLGAR